MAKKGGCTVFMVEEKLEGQLFLQNSIKFSDVISKIFGVVGNNSCQKILNLLNLTFWEMKI